MKKTLINVFVLVSVFCFFFTTKDANALTISPARIELRGDPGVTVGGDIVLINDQEETRTFFATFENFVADGDDGTPKFVGDKEGLATWISTTEAIVINPGEVKTIPFTVTIPANAKPGGYFSGIFWGSAPPGGGEGNVSIGTKIGMLVFLSVNGDIEENAGLSDFSTINNQWGYRALPVAFLYRLTNTGGDSIKPVGNVTIRSILGWRVARVTANPTEGRVLPGTTRKFNTVWAKDATQRPTTEESYSFFDSMSYQWKNFALGIFRASMSITYGATGQQSVQSNPVYFVVFPLELMVVIISGGAILFTGIRFILIRYHRSVIRKAHAIFEEQARRSKEE